MKQKKKSVVKLHNERQVFLLKGKNINEKLCSPKKNTII